MLIEIRLHVNEGTYKTLFKTKLEESGRLPKLLTDMCVPFGKAICEKDELGLQLIKKDSLQDI